VTILIVEDNFDILDALNTAISYAGFRVLTAPDRDIAIRKCLSVTPDLIVLDYHMPGMEIQHFLGEVKILNSNAGFILISGDPKIASIANQLGILKFLPKPFDFDELLNSLGSHGIMNRAEKELRKCKNGPPQNAVAILNSWTQEQRTQFRQAYQSGNWRQVYQLCMLMNRTNTPPSQQVLNHLLDATAAESDMPAVPT
jgi:DNA-binding response OmpR family regulator